MSTFPSTPLTTNPSENSAPGQGVVSPNSSVQAPGTVPALLGEITDLERLDLLDFLDLRTLQEIQDSFVNLTHFNASIHDAQGRQLTQPTDLSRNEENRRVLDWLLADASQSTDPLQSAMVAPIVVEGQRLGSITIDTRPDARLMQSQRKPLDHLGQKLGWSQELLDKIATAAHAACGPDQAAGVQFLYLMANTIARLCYQEKQLQQRVDELSTLYTLSTALAQQKDLEKLLQATAKAAVEAFRARAVIVRLLDEETGELTVRAVNSLSGEYLRKRPLLAEKSPIFRQALQEGVVYVADVQNDPRMMYPQDDRKEGLKSCLFALISFQDQPIGLFQLYTEQTRQFSRPEVDLLRAMAQLLAAAINSARLEVQRQEHQRVQFQLRMATAIQQRMLPTNLPSLAGFEIDARCVSSFELGGDFYDFIPLGPNLGVAVADVSGKGIPASLLMASVRASLRAFAQDVYDIDQIMVRLNQALTRDTLAHEFATIFYGVLDPSIRRLTYCNAGHEPPLLLRNGQFITLDSGGMVVGIDAQQNYDKGILDLIPGDMLLIYSDGLMDAQNFNQERFGRDRIKQAMRDFSSRSAHDALNHILWEMRRFAGMNLRTDDTTLIVIKCTG